MDKKQIRAFNTYQRITLGLFSIFNLWNHRTKLSTLVCLFVFGSSVILAYFFACNVYQNKHSVVGLLVHLGRLITAISTVFKLGYFAIKSKKILNLHTTLIDTYEENMARRAKATFCCSVYNFNIPAYIQMVSFIFACSLYGLEPSVYIIRHLIHFRLPDTNYTLMMSNGLGYAWTIPKGYLYHVHFVFELNQLVILCISAMSIDCFFSFYSYLLCANLTALSVTLNNLQSKEIFLDSVHASLKEHILLQKCRDGLESNFGLIALWHIVTNSVTLCIFTYLLMITDMSVGKMIYVFTYALGKLFQTFMYCWYGNCIRNCSEELREAVYFTNWQDTNLDVHVKTSITMALMQKPMSVNALVTTLDLETFSSILNTAVSYFWLLQSLEN